MDLSRSVRLQDFNPVEATLPIVQPIRMTFTSHTIYLYFVIQENVMRRSRKTLTQASESMTLVGKALNMSDDTLKRADEILRAVLGPDPTLVVGRSYSVFEAASLLVAGRGTSDEKRTTDIIAEYLRQSGLRTQLGVPEINRTVIMINKKVGAETKEYGIEQYIDNIINALQLESSIKNQALAIFESIRGCRVARRYPRHLAAALVYMAGNPKQTTQQKIASVSGSTDVTIRTTVREIRKAMAPAAKKRRVVFVIKRNNN